MDVLHLIGVVSHARKIDQRQLGSFLANHTDVQGLQALHKTHPSGFFQVTAAVHERLHERDPKFAKNGMSKSSKCDRTIQESTRAD